jgi:hypothetical protein
MLPSRNKLGFERGITAVETAAPTNDLIGHDVSAWLAVLLTAHSSAPVTGSANLVGARIKVRVWRWRSYAADGVSTPSGQWFANEEITLALDGDTSVGPMELPLMTYNSERMYFQVIEFVAGAGGTLVAELALYSYGNPRGDAQGDVLITSADASAAADAIATGNAIDDCLAGDHVYSNLRGDFTAVVATTTTITLTNLPAWNSLNHIRIKAIGQKNPGTTDSYDFLYMRGQSQLEVSYAAGTITIDDPILVVGRDVAVWYEDVPRYQGDNIDDTYHLQVRDEAFTIATQSERVEETDPLDERNVPDILADATSVAEGATVDFYLDMANYRYLSIQWIPADVNFTLKVYTTDEDNGTVPASCDYSDVTNAWFGAASFTAAAFLEKDTPTAVKYVHIEVVRAGGGVGASTHKLYTRRLW